MKWQVEFYKTHNNKSPVKDWISTLSTKTKVKIFRHLELLEKFGLELKEPYVKNLGDKLYEVRVKDQLGIYRIIYFANTGKKFVLLHGFIKKTQKTPKKELELAKQRMKEYKNE